MVRVGRVGLLAAAVVLAVAPVGSGVAAAAGTKQASGVLAAISCPPDGSALWCEAVGSGTDDRGDQVALIRVRDEDGWARQSPRYPAGSTGTHLDGVSCSSPTSCLAVGSYDEGSTVSTLAELWDGSHWVLTSTPDPSGSTDSTLTGVSCAAATSCMAVGEGSHDPVDGDARPLAERWDGSSWSIVATPSPDKAVSSELTGVSCPSTTACTAVGSSTAKVDSATLAEAWDGTSWAIQPTPDPAGSSALRAVSCPTTTWCAAVGGNGAHASVAEVLTGGTWALTPLTSPGGLEGVSCPSTTSCEATGASEGDEGPGETLTPFAEAWDGTAWTEQAVATPAGSELSDLPGVSCPPGADCQAAGSASLGPIPGEEGVDAPSEPLVDDDDANGWTVA